MIQRLQLRFISVAFSAIVRDGSGDAGAPPVFWDSENRGVFSTGATGACFSTCNIGTIYYCHCPLAPAILGQYITVSTRNSKAHGKEQKVKQI